MNDESIRNVALDFANIEQVVGSAVGPALNPLLPGNFFHYEAKKIARAVAVVNNLLANLVGIKSGDLEELASQPALEQTLSISLAAQVSESRLENAEDV